MSAANVTAVSDLYAAFSRGDVPAVLGGMSPDIDWHAPASVFGDAGHVHGAEAVGAFFAGLATKFQDFRLEPKELIDGGDRVVALGEHHITGGKGSVQIAFAHIWTVRDGKATAFFEVADTAPLAAVL